ncbi:MAG: hypothetical protein IJY61_04900 [Candidatus Gastranaerophilales bacterium]|nr:hypothetical protein [Candidatus Gastranaerophilales bacterium]
MNDLLNYIKTFVEKASKRINGVIYDSSDINQGRLKNKDSAFFCYEFMMSLQKKDYPKYLKEAYYNKTGEKLNLKWPKNLSQKIQWLKLYDNSPIKSNLTDKIKVRDYVESKIGSRYLKPILWIGERFEEIPFDTLPNSFVIKANHGCKWHIIVKNKEEYLSNKKLYNYSKARFDNWLGQNFFGFSDFEAQYINIKPKILIEPLLRENINEIGEEFWVWCVDSVPYTESKKFREESKHLSKILSQGFKFVRVDWMIYNNQLYFGEMTFTPLSGFIPDEMQYQAFYKELFKNLTLK